MRNDGYIGPFSIDAFEEVSSIEALNQGDHPRKIIWSPPMHSPTGHFPKGNFRDVYEIEQSHQSNWTVRGAEFLSIPNAEIGGNGFIIRNGRVFTQNGINPDGMNDLIKEGELPDIWRIGPFSDESELIRTSDPVAVFTNPHIVYGHFLCEMLPRAALVRNLQAVMPNLKIAVPHKFPDWIMEFVRRIFPQESLIRYDAETQRVKPSRVVLPTMMQEYGLFHPFCSHLINNVINCFPRSEFNNRKTYLSRRFCRSWRTIINEIEVESFLESRDFSVIYPEKLSIQEQISLLRSSSHVISPFSSALHGTMFCGPNTYVMSIGYMNNLQNSISRLRQHHLHYFIPESEGRRLVDYRGGYNIETYVDITELGKAVDQMIS